MKRNLFIILCCLFIVYLLFTNTSIVANSILNSCKLFITKVFISLFPMYILSKVLINYNFPYYIYRLTKSNYLYIFLLSLLGGSPSSYIILNDLVIKGIISKEDANSYIMANFFLNPLFLYTMLKLFLPLNIVFKIIFISYLSNIILYFIHKTNGKPLKRNKEIPLGDLLVKEINNAKDIFLNVLGMIILFNLLSLLIPKDLGFLVGILEVSNGLNYLVTLNTSLMSKSMLALIFINFGGISIFMQIKAVLKNSYISLTRYILGRFYASFLSVSIFLLSYFLGL